MTRDPNDNALPAVKIENQVVKGAQDKDLQDHEDKSANNGAKLSQHTTAKVSQNALLLPAQSELEEGRAKSGANKEETQ